MTANRGLFVRNNGNIGTTPIEGRLVLASMVAENAPGVPRQGLLDQKATTVVSGSASNMSYNVGPCSPVINRATNEGVYLFTLTGTTNVVTDAAPGTGSRWDLVYVKQNDLDKGDAVNTATVAVQKGTAGASPTKPYASLPPGAYVLAEALVQAGAANAADAKVTITQVWRYTALRGAPVPVRNKAERDEITPSVLTAVRRLDLGTSAIDTYDGAAWNLSGVIKYAQFEGPTIKSSPGSGSYWGLLTPNASKTFNNDFVSPVTYGPGYGLFIEKSGVYAIEGFQNFQQNPGNVTISMYANNGIGLIDSHSQGTYGDWQTTVGTRGIYLVAGTIVEFLGANSGGVYYNGFVRITKLS